MSESTSGFEYVKNCVDNPHFLDCPTIWVKDGKVGFFCLFVLKVSGVQKEGSVLHLFLV